MDSSRWTLFLFTILLVFVKETSAADHEIEKIINRVPRRERFSFIRYYSAIGYELSSSKYNDINDQNQFERLDSVSKFSVDLYQWLIKNKEAKNAKNTNIGVRTRQLHRNIICFPNNKCIDVGDVGVHP